MGRCHAAQYNQMRTISRFSKSKIGRNSSQVQSEDERSVYYGKVGDNEPRLNKIDGANGKAN